MTTTKTVLSTSKVEKSFQDERPLREEQEKRRVEKVEILNEKENTKTVLTKDVKRSKIVTPIKAQDNQQPCCSKALPEVQEQSKTLALKGMSTVDKLKAIALLVKQVLKPYHQSQCITKDQYKSILKSSVNKVYDCKEDYVNKERVSRLVLKYVAKYTH